MKSFILLILLIGIASCVKAVDKPTIAGRSGASFQAVTAAKLPSSVILNVAMNPVELHLSTADEALLVDTLNPPILEIKIHTDPTSGSANLLGTTTAEMINGVVKFDDLKIDAIGQGFKLIFEAAGVFSYITDEFEVYDSTAGNSSGEVIVTSTTGLVVSESGTTAQFSVSLDSEPTGDVTISISSADTDEVVPSVSSLIFTSLNWSTPQSVILTGVDDSIEDGTILATIELESGVSVDTRFSEITVDDVLISVLDDDKSGATVSGLNTQDFPHIIRENGNPKTIDFSLKKKPQGNVTFTFNLSNSVAGSTSRSSIVFNPSNWNIVQSVDVSAFDDTLEDNSNAFSLGIMVNSSDADYSGVNINAIHFKTEDNDGAGIYLETSTSLTKRVQLLENESSKNISMSLKKSPSSDVTLSFISSDSTEGLINPSSLTFTSTNWNISQSIEVRSVDDSLTDGNVDWVIGTTTSSIDSLFDNLSIEPIYIKTVDDDTPGYLITPLTTSGPLDRIQILEGGSSFEIPIRLTTQPLGGSVELTPISSDLSEAITDKSSLTFTSSNWNIPQILNVSCPDDIMSDWHRSVEISWNVNLITDITYDGKVPENIYFTCVDND